MNGQAFHVTPRLRFTGDLARCAALRPQALRLLENLRRENVFGLPVYSRCERLPSGDVLRCRRVGTLDEVNILAAPSGQGAHVGRDARSLAEVREGQFFAIPDCLARYDGLPDTDNAIVDGELAGWSLGYGRDVTVLQASEAGLPAAEGLPEAGIGRERGVFVLPGGADSGLLYGRSHIPDKAPFSVSCLVRLRRELEYDYTYDARGGLNPFRVYLLQSEDGSDFIWDCPGSIAPLLGFCSPHAHPDWSVPATYPWAPWNADFTANTEMLSGARRVATACPGAPVLSGDAYKDALGTDYPHPCGFVIGLQAAGLFLYNGNRLLGARLSHFESQFGYAPALTDPLPLDVWHHVVMTHAADGAVCVYVAREDATAASVFTGKQPLCAMDAACSWQASGVNAWTVQNGLTGAAIGAFRMNPVMDVCLPRFFHYALSPAQAYLLQLEALTGLFVADDHELGQGVAAGLSPIVIAKEAS